MSVLLPVVLLLATASVPSAALKCGPQPEPVRAIYALDGEILAETPGSIQEIVDPDEIHSAEVICMNPRDSTFNRTSGIPVYSVWTKSSPVARLEPTLAAIVQAQDEYHRRNARYTNDVDELVLPDGVAAFRISIEVRDNGWLATLTLDRYLSRCYVYDGDAPPSHMQTARRTPVCVRSTNVLSD